MEQPVRLVAHVTDTDEAAAVVARDLGYDVRLTADEMEYHHDTVVGDVVVQSSIVVDAELTCAVAPNDSYMIVQVRSGGYRVDPWGVQQHHGPGSAFVLPPDQQISLEVDRATVETTVVPAAELLSVAQDAFDVADLGPRRTAPRGVDPFHLRAWGAGAAFYREQILGRPELYTDDLLRQQATRQLVTSAITTFDLVETMTSTARESAAVRRALAYIDDHLREPMTLQDIAHAARVGPRALQYAFRRQRGETPMDRLRKARMAGAHADLVAADPTAGVTVGAVAVSWGFSNQGRFSAAYRLQYGVSPTATLRH